MKRNAFSLIELLVVIAIVALLAAIIFPVMSTVAENNRAGSAMSNMHDISIKMEQYRLDTQQYPPVLFGYTYSRSGAVVPMDKVLTTCTAAGDCGTSLVGLYPEYIKAWSTFTDPNNPAKLSDVTGDLPVNTLQDSGVNAGKLAPYTSSYYKADAFDSSPLVDGTGLRKDLNWVPRYQQSWTDIATDLDCGPDNPNFQPPFSPRLDLCGDLVPLPNWKAPDPTQQRVPSGDQRNNYTSQLRWSHPPGTTYVTCDTWHVPQQNSVLVLFLDGNVKKVDIGRFLGTGPFGAAQADVPIDGTHPQPDISVDNGISRGNFWRQRVTEDR